MKKTILGILSFLVIWASLFPSMTSAQSVGDDFWDVSTTSAGERQMTTEAANNDVNYLIGKLDFLGSSLIQKSLEYFLIYPACFSTKWVGDNAQVFYNPKICYERGGRGKGGTAPILVPGWKINVRQLMEWQFVVANSAPLLFVTLFVSFGILFSLILMKYTDWGGSSSGWEGGEGWTTGGWENSLIAGSWMLKGRVWGWLIEKILNKDKVQDWEEKKNSLAGWFYIAAFFFFLFFSALILSNGINGKIRTAFDQSYTGLSVLYGVGIIYTLAFLAFLAIIMTLSKYSLISFIQMDLSKTEETSAPNKIAKLIAIGVSCIAVAYVAFSALVTFVSVVLKVG